jgi:hypothetical protein
MSHWGDRFWADKFREKHSKMNPDVLNRIDFCVSPQVNIERKRIEAEKCRLESESILKAIERNKEDLLRNERNFEREYRFNELIYRETCALIAALEDEVQE